VQLALAQWLISKGRITHANVYTGGGAVVRWAIDRLDLDGDDGQAALREFRRALSANKAAALAHIERLESLVWGPQTDSLLDRVHFLEFYQEFREAQSKRDAELAVVNPGECVARKSDVERSKNTVKDLRERLAEMEGEQGMIDLKKIAATYKKRRKNSTGRKYIMFQIKAIAGGLGNERLSELCMLFNLMCLYELGGGDGEFDEIEEKLLAEAAAGTAPSPTTWSQTPLEFRDVTYERAGKVLAGCDVVFAMNDHAHRSGKDHLTTQFGGFSHELNRPIVVLVDNSVAGKSGEATAAVVAAHVKHLKLRFGGTMTDSASAAIDKQSEVLAAAIPGDWHAVGGCELHVHNLTISVPYEEANGPAELGEPSALMSLRNVGYLQERYYDLEQLVCASVPELEGLVGVRKIVEAVLTRWQTISKASRWARKYRAKYAVLCGWMYDLLEAGSKAREMYGVLVRRFGLRLSVSELS